jgi:hypothetical protein
MTWCQIGAVDIPLQISEVTVPHIYSNKAIFGTASFEKGV